MAGALIAGDAIVAEILRQVAGRGAGKSICPSEVARALSPAAPEWRSLMSRVRATAVAMAREGRIEVLRKGRPVDPAAELRGVIRLRAKED